jgi:hypothetical protein
VVRGPGRVESVLLYKDDLERCLSWHVGWYPVGCTWTINSLQIFLQTMKLLGPQVVHPSAIVPNLTPSIAASRPGIPMERERDVFRGIPQSRGTEPQNGAIRFPPHSSVGAMTGCHVTSYSLCSEWEVLSTPNCCSALPVASRVGGAYALSKLRIEQGTAMLEMLIIYRNTTPISPTTLLWSADI